MATPPLGVECGPGFEPPSAVGAGGASHFINVYENIKGWCQATQDKRQWAETYVQEVLPEHEKVLTCRRSCTGTGCQERLQSLPHWRYSTTLWTQPCAACSGMALLDPAGGTR